MPRTQRVRDASEMHPRCIRVPSVQHATPPIYDRDMNVLYVFHTRCILNTNVLRPRCIRSVSLTRVRMPRSADEYRMWFVCVAFVTDGSRMHLGCISDASRMNCVQKNKIVRARFEKSFGQSKTFFSARAYDFFALRRCSSVSRTARTAFVCVACGSDGLRMSRG